MKIKSTHRKMGTQIVNRYAIRRRRMWFNIQLDTTITQHKTHTHTHIHNTHKQRPGPHQTWSFNQETSKSVIKARKKIKKDKKENRERKKEKR